MELANWIKREIEARARIEAIRAMNDRRNLARWIERYEAARR